MSAAEKSTGKSQKITITNEKGRLSKDDIERMVSDAEALAEEDKKAMERVEAKNELESYLYNARNTLREEKTKEKLGNNETLAAEDVLKEHIEWLDSHGEEDTVTYKDRYKVAEEAIRPVLMKLYAGNDMGKGDESAPGPGPTVEEVD